MKMKYQYHLHPVREFRYRYANMQIGNSSGMNAREILDNKNKIKSIRDKNRGWQVGCWSKREKTSDAYMVNNPNPFLPFYGTFPKIK